MGLASDGRLVCCGPQQANRPPQAIRNSQSTTAGRRVNPPCPLLRHTGLDINNFDGAAALSAVCNEIWLQPKNIARVLTGLAKAGVTTLSDLKLAIAVRSPDIDKVCYLDLQGRRSADADVEKAAGRCQDLLNAAGRICSVLAANKGSSSHTSTFYAAAQCFFLIEPVFSMCLKCCKYR